MTSSPSRGELYGREAELVAIRHELGRLAGGASAAIVIEGGAGIGKSRLLAEILDVARAHGARVCASAADPGETLVELSALLAALFDGPEPLLDRAELATLRAQTGQRYWLLRDIQSLLEQAALETPILIAIDDAHWADSGTAAALRALPARLSGLPVAWVVATRPGHGSPPARAIDQLQRNGATTIILGPLEDAAADQLAGELLGGVADEGISALLHETGGSPYLLVELLLGLRDENRIRVADGRAELVDRRLPSRVQNGMRERLGRLSEAANTTATVAASLGRTFTYDQLARTLGWPPSDLLLPVGELLAASVLAEGDDQLSFWHDLTREAVRASVPASARRALDRQAAGTLLEGGALPVEVAAQLAESAEPGDGVAVTTLLEAAQALLPTDAVTAAEFGRRALEIAPSQHPRRGELVGLTAIALHIAGRSEDAIAFADTALRETLPAQQEAEIRLSIAGMFSITPETRIATGRAALLLSDVTDVTRARHFACLFHNFVTAGRTDEAGVLLDAARAAVDASGDSHAVFALHNAQSAFEYSHDRFIPALDLATRACREGVSAGDDQRLRLAQHWRGEVLSTLDRHDEAFAIASDGLAAAQRDRHEWAYEMFDVWRGRLLLRVGRLSEAAAVLEGRFSLEDGYHANAVLDAAGIVALGWAALHQGDRRQVRRLADIAHVMFERGTPAVRGHAAWLLALFASADGDPAGATRWVRAGRSAAGRPTLPRFPLDIGDEVELARIALATGDGDLAQLALATARDRSAHNPGISSIEGVAAHVRGLVEESPAQLEEAVRLFEGSARRFEPASALEDLGVHLASADRDAGIDALGRALASYTEIGATWDAGRVRSRLRALGVRRRIMAAEPETQGWGALTTAELTVARLVVEGLTNREVADRLFLSPHTVNSHLRHVFTKLGIHSRVELVRLVSNAEG